MQQALASPGLREDRVPVLAGGVAIMSGGLRRARPRRDDGGRRRAAPRRALGPARARAPSRHPRGDGGAVRAALPRGRGAGRSAWATSRAQLCAQLEPTTTRLECRMAQLPRLGGAAARDRHLDRAGRLPQALGLHPRQRRHAGLLAPGAGVALEPRARAARQALARCARPSTTIRASPRSRSACASR